MGKPQHPVCEHADVDLHAAELQERVCEKNCFSRAGRCHKKLSGVREP